MDIKKKVNYFDTLQRMGPFLSQGLILELLSSPKKRDELCSGGATAGKKLLLKFEFLFNRKEIDEDESTFLAFEIGQIQKHIKVLENKESELLESAAIAYIGASSQAIQFSYMIELHDIE